MKLPQKPPSAKEILEKLKNEDPETFLYFLDFASPVDKEGRYRHWDKIRHLELPDGIKSHKIWWSLLKLSRRQTCKKLDFKGVNGVQFCYNILDHFNNILHFLDQHTSGNIMSDGTININEQTKNYFLINSLIEESLNSSQLEGATTTRHVAKKMIKEERSPRDKSEQMILNNFEAIQFIKTIVDERLTSEMIKEIHSIISKNTLDNIHKCGAYRDDKDEIHVVSNISNEILHTPPKSSEIEKYIQLFCDFANDEENKPFIHPVVSAIIIHFLFAYIHPFVDGNGRTARALFYWYMLKKGYWLMEFVSISKIIKNSPAKYGRSFLYTETDENDLTYFIDYQLTVVMKAIDEMKKYIKRKSDEIGSIVKLLQKTSLADKLNFRQLTLLKSALKTPGLIYTIQEYKNTYNIVYQTARKDMLELSDNYKLFLKVKEKNSFVFIVPSDLIQRIEGYKK